MKPASLSLIGVSALMAFGTAIAQAGEGAPAGSTAGPPDSAPQAAEEEFLTAGELLGLCRSEKGSTGESQCLEFIFGLAQTVAAMQQNDPSVQYFCIDPQVTAIQSVQRVLVQGIEAAPATQARPAFEVAIDVLGREWPCMSFETL